MSSVIGGLGLMVAYIARLITRSAVGTAAAGWGLARVSFMTVDNTAGSSARIQMLLGVLPRSEARSSLKNLSSARTTPKPRRGSQGSGEGWSSIVRRQVADRRRLQAAFAKIAWPFPAALAA